MMRVTARALSVFCPHCQTRVSMENLRIVGSHPGKRLATAGDILVEPSSRLQLDIVCNRIVIRGRIKGSVSAGEYVEIEGTGHVIGDITAPKLVVKDGGGMQGRFIRTAPEESTAVETEAAPEPTPLPERSVEPEIVPAASKPRIQPRPLRPTGL